MKKKKIYLAGMLLSALIFAGCSSEETAETGTAGERVALRVMSGIKATRAVDNLWQKGDAIGVFMLSGEAVDYYNNIKYVTEDAGTNGTFNPSELENTIYLPDDGTNRDFIAYYPWTDKLTDDVYNIDLSDQTSQEDIDFMTAAKVSGIDKSKPTVPFVFTHKLSKIEMEVKAGADITDADLEGIVVKLTGQPTTGTFNLLTSTEVSPSDAEKTAITLLTAADGKKAEAIVFPSADFSGMNFTFDTKAVGSYSCRVPSEKASKFEAGKKYKYTITINKTEIETTSTITDWKPGNDTGDSGKAE